MLGSAVHASNYPCKKPQPNILLKLVNFVLVLFFLKDLFTPVNVGGCVPMSSPMQCEQLHFNHQLSRTSYTTNLASVS